MGYLSDSLFLDLLDLKLGVCRLDGFLSFWWRSLRYINVFFVAQKKLYFGREDGVKRVAFFSKNNFIPVGMICWGWVVFFEGDLTLLVFNLHYSSVDYVAEAFWFLLFCRCLKATVIDLLISILGFVLGGAFHLNCDERGVIVWIRICRIIEFAGFFRF